MKYMATIFISLFLLSNIYASDRKNQESLDECSKSYIQQTKNHFEQAPYLPTQGFLKNKIDQFRLNTKQEIFYIENDDQKNVEFFIENILPTMVTKKLSKDLSTPHIKNSIITMMQFEKENKQDVCIYHGTCNTVTLMTEFNTELYRALGIIKLDDKDHKILRPFANIFDFLKTANQLELEYQDDSNSKFSKRCLSCVPYIFGLLNSDTQPINFWLNDCSWKTDFKFIEKIKKIFKVLELNLDEKYIQENYQKILDTHEVTTWGGSMIQIALSAEDLTTAKFSFFDGMPVIDTSYGYMCSKFGRSWHIEADAAKYFKPHSREIHSDVLKTTLQTREDQPQKFIDFHQLRYMPKEIPKHVHIYYAHQNNELKIEAFRNELLSQIKKDIQGLNRAQLQTSLFFSSPR
ncbi:MAG: hypothetical protein ACRYGR_07175 [Janthinobacterium lividum]